MDNFYALIARMKNIGRWALMRSVTPENVQEHSHMVAVLAHALAVIRRDVYGVLDIGGDDRGALALGRYVDSIAAENDYEMLFVVNRSRPLTGPRRTPLR